MQENENAEIARRFLSAWNAGAEQVVDALAYPELTVTYTHFEEPVRGIERFKDTLRRTHHSFPDMAIRADEVISQGEQVVIRWTYTGTHQQEELFGVQPSGRRVQVQGISVYRIIDGRVVEESGIVDNLSLMMQLQA